MELMKACRICNTLKPVDQFEPKTRQCKQCRAEYKRQLRGNITARRNDKFGDSFNGPSANKFLYGTANNLK